MKKFIQVLLYVISIVSVLIITVVCVEAEETDGTIPNEETTENIDLDNVSSQSDEIPMDTQENALEGKKSGIATWFEDNLGWIFGIPSGTLVSLGSIYLSTIKSKKEEKEKEIKEKLNNSKIKETLENTQKIIEKTQEEIEYAKGVANRCLEIYDNLTQRFDTMEDVFVEVKNKFSYMDKDLEDLINNTKKLQNEFAVILSNTKEYVVNGKARKVNEIIGE